MTGRIFVLILLLGFSQLYGVNSLPWLKTKGSELVDEQQRTVILRGVNLGGWLVEEMWMLPFKKTSSTSLVQITDHTTLWQVFEDRFGTEKMSQIRSAFRKTWINESDFARIRKAGLNCVRLPFLASLIEESDGFEVLDKAIDAAAKEGIYVILDMHGTYGGQSEKQHTGKAGQNLLFHDPQMVKKTADAWEKIALRYKNVPTVAAYDLMNEPMGANDSKTLHQVHDAFYQAIRKVDPHHIIIIEDGYRGIMHIPHPKSMGWENVMLSTHTYVGKAQKETECLKNFEADMQSVDEMQSKYRVPYYLGEFNVKPSPLMGIILSKFIIKLQEKKRSWSLWSYKIAGRCPRGKMWGLYLKPKDMKYIDPFQDSEKTCLKKIAQLRTERFMKNDLLIKACESTTDGIGLR
jgi:hypothetical protein